ncbi:MAG: GPW/gp25 family protein [Cyanobacteria bacterium J06635_15]
MPEQPTQANAHLNAQLGTGVAFPMRMSVQGGLQLSSARQNLAESIRIILSTKPGERVYRPNFGCRLSELTFAPMNPNTLLMIRLYVESALTQWEPRIVVDQVLTQPEPERGRVDITIHYHPKDTHDRRSLVYPFYLLPTEE